MSERDLAKALLRNLLQAGPCPSTQVVEKAKARGLALSTLRRAKAELGVRAKKDGPNHGWTWRLLKSSVPVVGEEANSPVGESLAAFGRLER